MTAGLARKTWPGVAAALAIVGAQSVLRPFLFLRALQSGRPASAYEDVAASTIEVPALGVQALVLRPREGARATVVAVPGLHPHGIDDPRFRSFLAAAASAGFQVVAPDLPELRRLELTPASSAHLVELVRALPGRVPEATLQNVGLLGISYGSGLVFEAAADPVLRGRVHFVATVGAYHQLSDALHFAASDPRAHSWPRLIFAARHLDPLVPRAQRAAVERVIRLHLQLRPEEAERLAARLPAPARAWAEELVAGLGTERRRRFEEVLGQLRDESARLSPAAVVPRLPPELRFYLVHGARDDLVPARETLALAAALRASGHPHVHALVTGALRHADAAPGSGAADAVALLVWTRALLGEASPGRAALLHPHHDAHADALEAAPVEEPQVVVAGR